MATAQYFVVLHQGQWKISFNGYLRPIQLQERGSGVAVEEAHKMGKQGREAQVLVQGIDGEARPEWTYGSDPYPPRQPQRTHLAR